LAHVSGHEVNDVSSGTHPWQIAHFPISAIWWPWLSGFLCSGCCLFSHTFCWLVLYATTWKDDSLFKMLNLLTIHLLLLHPVFPSGQLQQTHKLLLSIPLLLNYHLLTESKELQTEYLTWKTLALQTMLCHLT
jgi:hypothetical protein